MTPQASDEDGRVVIGMQYKIPFNKPFIAGKELYYVARAVTRGQIAADGFYTASWAEFLEGRFRIARALLTPSCTAALEMSTILCGLGPGDEVILLSYDFVSTANAIARQEASPSSSLASNLAKTSLPASKPSIPRLPEPTKSVPVLSSASRESMTPT